jgi:hypothetical protein
MQYRIRESADDGRFYPECKTWFNPWKPFDVDRNGLYTPSISFDSLAEARNFITTSTKKDSFHEYRTFRKSFKNQ